MWTQGALPAFLLHSQLDLVLTSMVLLREDIRLMFGEGAGRHRGRGRAGGGGSSLSVPTAWVEGGSSNNPPSHQGALELSKPSLIHP